MARITLDPDVPLVPARKSRSLNDPRAAELLAMDIDTGNNSFYVEGGTKKSVRSLVDLGKRIGVHLIVREFEAGADKLNDWPGVRIWRVSEDKLR